MKTATIFVLAVTAFTGLIHQSSASPQSRDSGSDGRTHCCVGGDSLNDFKSLATTKIDSSDQSLAFVVKTLNDASPSTDAEQEALAKATEFMGNFVNLADGIHSDLAKVAESGDIALLKELKERITNAVAETKQVLGDLSANLESGVKVTFQENIAKVVSNAENVATGIDKLLAF